jgi:hypothetical protein
MNIEDSTGVPEDLLNTIIRFVDPDRLLEHYDDLIITNQDNDKNSHRSGMFVPWGGKRNDIKGRVGKIVIFRRPGDTVDDLVRTLAHEFRHMWQWYHNWTLLEDEELCEMDARVYAKLMVRLLNEKEEKLTWKRVDNAKRIYVPISEKILLALKDSKVRTKLLSD